MIKVEAPAKINLSLVVNGLNNDGLHSLDMLVTSIDVCDTVYIIPRQDAGVRTVFSTYKNNIDCKSIDPKNNTCLKAAELMVAAFDIQGADIVVVKNIPLQAGIGGSSADAAAVIRALAEFNGIAADDPTLASIAEECGSDCLSMMSNGFKRIQGTGEKVVPIETEQKLYFVLGMGETGVSTAECYAKHDELLSVSTDVATQAAIQQQLVEKRSNNHSMQAALERNAPVMYEAFVNDLQDAAIDLNFEIANTLAVLQSTNPLACSMTGSGAMCFAVFESREDAEIALNSVRGSLPVLLLAETI